MEGGLFTKDLLAIDRATQGQPVDNEHCGLDHGLQPTGRELLAEFGVLHDDELKFWAARARTRRAKQDCPDPKASDAEGDDENSALW